MCFMKVTEQISLPFQALFIYLQIYWGGCDVSF